ncbi:hypothetical protein [Pedobacter sp. SYP-B3415]|uniref:hypothetical protein n=1 Tax=Pedobacter sp. SYP-B3415 TaxID=2496641 RepID=UPI00101BDE9E|nr:hypothetical protein [Pedobacter sp. SYP-B3415]
METSQQFPHPVTQVKKYIVNAGIFTLLLHSGEIVNYEPDEPQDFQRLLDEHQAHSLQNQNAS